VSAPNFAKIITIKPNLLILRNSPEETLKFIQVSIFKKFKFKRNHRYVLYEKMKIYDFVKRNTVASFEMAIQIKFTFHQYCALQILGVTLFFLYFTSVEN
jgi:hypothetical protein